MAVVTSRLQKVIYFSISLSPTKRISFLSLNFDHPFHNFLTVVRQSILIDGIELRSLLNLNMVAIDLLEERISELEKRVYGSSVPLIDDPIPQTSIVDSLLHVNTLISSAISGQEKASALVRRLPELNELLETSYEDEDLHTEAKFEIIMAMKSETMKNLELLNKMNELMPALEIDKIKNVPELTPKLEHLTIDYLEAYENSNEINNAIHKVFAEYNKIIDTISNLMVSLDAAVTDAEIAAAPKKQLD